MKMIVFLSFVSIFFAGASYGNPAADMPEIELEFMQGSCADEHAEFSIEADAGIFALNMHASKASVSVGADFNVPFEAITCSLIYIIKIPNRFHIEYLDFYTIYESLLPEGSSINFTISHRPNGARPVIFSRRLFGGIEGNNSQHMGKILVGQLNPDHQRCGAHIKMASTFQIQSFHRVDDEHGEDKAAMTFLNANHRPGMILSKIKLKPCF